MAVYNCNGRCKDDHKPENNAVKKYNKSEQISELLMRRLPLEVYVMVTARGLLTPWYFEMGKSQSIKNKLLY